MEQPKIKLAETVIIIDAAHYNFVTSDLRRYFENRLNRKLADIEIIRLVSDLALEAGIRQGENEIQLLWVYDDQSAKLENSVPADLKIELNGVAFKNLLGEFASAGVPCSGMVTREDLFLDLLNITADSADVKRIVLFPNDREYTKKVHKAIENIKEKEIIIFKIGERKDEPASCKIANALFPLLHAYGIQADEL